MPVSFSSFFNSLAVHMKFYVHAHVHVQCMCSERFPMQVLWPYLLEFIVPVQYTGGVGIVSRCLAEIGKTKREEEAEDYELNFDELRM